MFCVIPLFLFVSNALALLSEDKPYYDLADAEKHFADFIQKYGRQYETEEEYNARFEIFKEHLVNINHLNGIHEASFAVNDFSDISYEEFSSTRHGLEISNVPNENELVKVEKEWIEEAPDSLDYRKQGLVTPARDQRKCGSCYAFATVANIEGQHAKKHKELLTLSVQQGLDCDSLDHKCKGGTNLVNIMNELAKQGGIERDTDYPYEAMNDTCRTDKSKIAVKVLGGFEIDTSTEEKLKGAVAKYGPLAVAMNAWPLLPDYHGGVLSPTDCNTRYLNHAVLVVGYGKEPKKGGKDYWIAKNSWGGYWGDRGYFFLERGKKLCGFGTVFTSCSKVA